MINNSNHRKTQIYRITQRAHAFNSLTAQRIAHSIGTHELIIKTAELMSKIRATCKTQYSDPNMYIYDKHLDK